MPNKISFIQFAEFPIIFLDYQNNY